MQHFLIISLSASDESISRLGIDTIHSTILANGHRAEVIDIRDYPPFWMNSKKLDGAPVEYRSLSKKVRAATGVIFLSPVYCYSTSSIFKLLTELFTEELARKPVAIVTAAGTLRSHLAISDVIMNMIFEMGSFVFPNSAQITGEDVSNGQLSKDINERIIKLVREFIGFSHYISAFNKDNEADDEKLEHGFSHSMKFNHFNITTQNLERSLQFYQDVFGVKYLRHLGAKKVVTSLNGFEFFIEEVESPIVDPHAHMGIRTNPETVKKFKEHLVALDIPLVLGNNPTADIHLADDGFRSALYFKDPDGWLIEVYSPEKQTLVEEGLLIE